MEKMQMCGTEPDASLPSPGFTFLQSLLMFPHLHPEALQTVSFWVLGRLHYTHVCILSHFSRVWLCDPWDYTVHGILQARILEWVGFPFSRWSSQCGDRTPVFHIAGRFFTSWATREAPKPRLRVSPHCLSVTSSLNLHKTKTVSCWCMAKPIQYCKVI